MLERLDQTFDGFLPLRQIAFGRLLKFAERLFRQPQKFRRGLFQRVRAQRLESVAQIRDRLFLRGLGVAQGLFVKRFLLRENFFRRRLIRLRRGERSFALRKLLARLRQFRFALCELLAQIIFQTRIGRSTPFARAAEQPADEQTQRATDAKAIALDSDADMNQKCATTSISTLAPLGSAGDLDGRARRKIFREIFCVISFMPAKFARSVRNTVLFTTLANVRP